MTILRVPDDANVYHGKDSGPCGARKDLVVKMALWIFLLTCGGAPRARMVRAADFSPEQLSFFESKVRPLLVEHCYACHSEEAKSLQGGLRLDSRARAIEGGDSGAAVTPGQSAESLLIEAVRWESFEMPPRGKLSETQIATLVEWVEMGAPWPASADATVELDVDATGPDWESLRRNHWAFRPLERREPPAVVDVAWPRGPIDRFVLSRLEAEGLQPNPQACKRMLIRRVYLDLVGLPPTPDEVDAFLADSRPKAFEFLVDRLLASEHYGERWARHWLDVARYSDGLGGFLDKGELPYAWRYRDWVVSALNRDLPYDEFVKRQIAGDLLASKPEPEATGFFAVGPTYNSDGGDPQATAQARAETLADRVDTFSRGFLGLTVACARCHDHKFDPITTKDYYALAGVFDNCAIGVQPIASPEEIAAFDQAMAQIKTCRDALKQWENRRSQAAIRARMRQSADYLEALVRFRQQRSQSDGISDPKKFAAASQLSPVALERWEAKLDDASSREHFPHLTPLFDAWPTLDDAATSRALATEAIDAVRQFQLHVDQILAKLEGEGEQPSKLEQSERALFKRLSNQLYKAPLNDLLDEAEEAERRRRQEQIAQLQSAAPQRYPEAHAMRESGSADMHVAIRGDLQRPGELAPRRFLQILADVAPETFTEGSGRRELADAVVSSSNPLTARVMVNRIWLWHFGEALVRTPSNFGKLGDAPTHPELLDWLAGKFMEDGWSMKKMHREIMLSATWQMSSAFDQAKFDRDGDNRLIWRMNPRKLEVEIWRDSLLAVTGELDRSVGGAPTEEILASRRRTLYSTISRNGDRFVSDEFLRLFDFPAPRTSSARRTASIVPQQYLFMLNSPFIIDRASALARELERLGGNEARIHEAYRRLYARDAEKREIEAGLAFLGKTSTADARWPQYAQVLMNAHEFMQIR